MQPQFISPVANRKQSRSKLPIILVIVVAVLAIGGGIAVLITSSANNPVKSMDQLNARMTALISYIAEGRTSARSPDVIKITTDANILLTGDATAIKSATSKAGAKGKTKEVIASEKQRGDGIVKELKSAAVDGRFDRKFVEVLEEELTDTQGLLREVNEDSSSDAVKSATKNTFDHITSLLDALDRAAL